MQKSNSQSKQKFTKDVMSECAKCSSFCDSNMHEVVDTLRNNFGRIRDLVSAEVLAGTNEKALDILRTCGCKVFVPGTFAVA